MGLKDRINGLRRDVGMTQARFAEALQVSPQAVQKWESGASVPELDKLVQMSKLFGVSLDALVLGSDVRSAEEINAARNIRPSYDSMHEWEVYSETLMTEYRQCMEEGLDVSPYENLFRAVSYMPRGENRERIADVLFDIVMNAQMRPDYAYTEPSTLDGIRALRKPFAVADSMPDRETLRKKLHGAWLGRICGCMLGKSVEGIRTDELYPLLKQSGNYPMHRYIRRTDITAEMAGTCRFPLDKRVYIDDVTYMPYDDDTNYVVLAQEIVEKYGRDFTSRDVARAWLDYQPKYAYCTAERVAYRNFVNGYQPPESAVYKNAYREWIGAQIRGDYFGYINPGDPETAAEMAFRDASISHVKNGIYGEMFAAAMIACAAVTDDIHAIIRGGLAQIPATSRLYEAVEKMIDLHAGGATIQECYQYIHSVWDEHNPHDWCHTISNAMIVVTGLLYGGGDFGKSVCIAVEPGFDTDCNGATVGSVIGVRNGIEGIDSVWSAPFEDKLETTIFGVGTVSIAERAEMTMRHLPD